MSTGIYAYWDNENNYYVYVGKDSNLDKNKRHNDHLQPSKYDEQQINYVLQNNIDRYEYKVLMEGNYSDKQLNKMEKFLIKHLKTFKSDYPNKSVFNFTKGGDGCKYWEGKTRQDMVGENNPNYGNPNNYHHTEETKRKISESGKGKKHSKETRKKLSEVNKRENNPMWKDYARIVKLGFDTNNKQRYAIRYNGKFIKRSLFIEKLEKWFKENYPNEKLIKEVI